MGFDSCRSSFGKLLSVLSVELLTDLALYSLVQKELLRMDRKLFEDKAILTVPVNGVDDSSVVEIIVLGNGRGCSTMDVLIIYDVNSLTRNEILHFLPLRTVLEPMESARLALVSRIYVLAHKEVSANLLRLVRRSILGKVGLGTV